MTAEETLARIAKGVSVARNVPCMNRARSLCRVMVLQVPRSRLLAGAQGLMKTSRATHRASPPNQLLAHAGVTPDQGFYCQCGQMQAAR